jgi:uncharacterized membrane protein YagU involved in acid resistance
MLDTSFGFLIWKSIVAGIIATTSMEVLFRMCTKTGIANIDMVRAIGSLITKTFDSYYKVGVIVHFISGIFFAFVYALVFTTFNVTGILNNIGAGLLMGFIHGTVVSFVLVIAVAEHHPLEEFRTTGFSVAIAHWAGHLVYGLVVGLIIGLMN